MNRILLSATFLAVCLSAARGQDNQAKVDQLKKEIAELRSKLEAKEAELSRLAPITSRGPINLGTAEIGRVGKLSLGMKDGAGVVVEQIIDGNSLLGKVVYIQATNTRFIFTVPTKGRIDGRHDPDLDDKVWRITDTRKHGGSTYFVLEPHSEMKK